MIQGSRWTQFLLAAAVLGCRAGPLRAESDSELAKDWICGLLERPHGMNMLTAQDVEHIAAMRRVISAEHVKIITDAMALPERQQDGLAEPALQKHQRALLLLGAIGGDLARAAVLEDYQQVTSRLRAIGAVDEQTPPELRQFGRVLAGLRRAALDQLGELKFDQVLDEVLRDLDSADASTQVVMLRYIGHVAGRRPDVLDRLKTAAADPQSPLSKQSPDALAAAIQELRQSARDDGDKR